MSDRPNQRRRRIIGGTATAIAAGRLGMLPARAALPEPEGSFPGFAGATAWINTRPLTPEALRGKVVIADFCTYTCINWMRTLPYVRAWAARYRDHGLVVVGVHTPEFGFERDLGNVQRALRAMRVDYPVAVDSDYAIWRAFHNGYWPALYLADAHGTIRHRKFGEGGYPQTERIIQEVLTDAGSRDLDTRPVTVDPDGFEAPADWHSLKSPENYVGYERTENFVSPGGALADRPRVYAAPDRLTRNEWALQGNWTMGRNAVQSNASNARIACRFHARDLHLVLGPAAPGKPVAFRVSIDGRPPQSSHGSDVDGQGRGVINAPRLYQLIRQPTPIVDRRFEIEFLDPGAQAFAFTFG